MLFSQLILAIFEYVQYLYNNNHNNYQYKEMTEEPKSTKEILKPKAGWLPALAKACKSDKSYISQVVNNENIDSKHWPIVAQLANQIDPIAFEARMDFIKTSTAA